MDLRCGKCLAPDAYCKFLRWVLCVSKRFQQQRDEHTWQPPRNSDKRRDIKKSHCASQYYTTHVWTWPFRIKLDEGNCRRREQTFIMLKTINQQIKRKEKDIKAQFFFLKSSVPIDLVLFAFSFSTSVSKQLYWLKSCWSPFIWCWEAISSGLVC